MKASIRKADTAPYPDERHCSFAILINDIFIPENERKVNASGHIQQMHD